MGIEVAGNCFHVDRQEEVASFRLLGVTSTTRTEAPLTVVVTAEDTASPVVEKTVPVTLDPDPKTVSFAIPISHPSSEPFELRLTARTKQMNQFDLFIRSECP